jgi:hypothetical protein
MAWHQRWTFQKSWVPSVPEKAEKDIFRESEHFIYA